MTTKAFYFGYGPNGATVGAAAYVFDGTNGACISPALSIGLSDNAATIMAQVPGVVNAYCSANFGFVPDTAEWIFGPAGGVVKSFSNPSRALNTAFQPSTVSDTLGIYSVSVACTLSLSGGQAGSIVLEYADNSAFTSNVKTAAQLSNANTGTLTIGLNTLQTMGGVVSGIIPVGKWARLRTVNTTGTPTQTSISSQEILF